MLEVFSQKIDGKNASVCFVHLNGNTSLHFGTKDFGKISITLMVSKTLVRALDILQTYLDSLTFPPVNSLPPVFLITEKKWEEMSKKTKHVEKISKMR